MPFTGEAKSLFVNSLFGSIGARAIHLFFLPVVCIRGDLGLPLRLSKRSLSRKSKDSGRPDRKHLIERVLGSSTPTCYLLAIAPHRFTFLSMTREVEVLLAADESGRSRLIEKNLERRAPKNLGPFMIVRHVPEVRPCFAA